jgi:hypothetical protein
LAAKDKTKQTEEKINFLSETQKNDQKLGSNCRLQFVAGNLRRVC